MFTMQVDDLCYFDTGTRNSQSDIGSAVEQLKTAEQNRYLDGFEGCASKKLQEPDFDELSNVV